MSSEHNTDENISWGIHKSYKELYDALWDKVPVMGEIKGKNYKKLEKFRKASNVIYDIFNNGLMNRGRELRVLKLKVYDLSLPSDCCEPNWDHNDKVVWEAFRPIIIEAATEQLRRTE
tara:strand:- start:299 stop:652 length:354 start_codon:yes stop_codon:yes gene_type:complete